VNEAWHRTEESRGMRLNHGIRGNFGLNRGDPRVSGNSLRTKVKKENEVMRCQVKVQRISKVSMKGKHTDQEEG